MFIPEGDFGVCSLAVFGHFILERGREIPREAIGELVAKVIAWLDVEDWKRGK